MLLRNPTVADVIEALSQFSPEQPFLSAQDVFTEVGFESARDPQGNPFLVMSILGRPTRDIITPTQPTP